MGAPGDFEAVASVADAVSTPVVLSLSRTREADIDRALEAVAKAERPGIHIFIATSDLHMEQKLGMSPQEVVDAAAWAVERAGLRSPVTTIIGEVVSLSDELDWFEPACEPAAEDFKREALTLARA